MARFLSADWLEEMAAAAASSEDLRRSAADADLTIRQVVRGGPEGDVAYTVRLARGAVEVTTDPAAEADIEVTSDYDTAVEVSRGRLSPAVALSAGRLRLRGKVGLLAEHRDAFAGFGDLFGRLRATTEY